MEKGNELQKRYMILNLLGEGGEGRTYLAYDAEQNRNVVIKELNDAPTDKQLTAWRKLIQLGKLEGIVELFDVFEEEQKFYMILEHVAGKNGMEYLRACGQGIAPEQVLNMMKPVITGVSLLHENGLLHRDISTDNLIVTEQGTVVLCDLSLVCENEEGGVSEGVSKVKNGFSPLELYQGTGRQGPWCDVYELCATMYHLMTGQLLASPANRSEEDDPLAGVSVRIPEPAASLMRAGLQLNWEYRLDNLGPFCQMEVQTDGGFIPLAPAPVTVQTPQEAYIVPQEMRTMPVNVQEVRSFQPDNAMNAKQKNIQGSDKKILIAVGIVCALLLVFAAGFGYYRLMNDEDTEETADRKGKDKDEKDSDKKSKDSDISLDELIEMYAEYRLQDNELLASVNSYKLVYIDDDELPECLLASSGYRYGVSGILYYNKDTKECDALVFTHGGAAAFDLAVYAEKENIFCVMDDKDAMDNKGNLKNHYVDKYYYQFNDGGEIVCVGYSTGCESQGVYSVENRTGVKKAEYDEYNADFGEFSDTVSYDNMYVNLNKAYEKFLDEQGIGSDDDSDE